MSKNRGRFWVWLLVMAGIVGLLVVVVDMVREDRGSKLVREAYRLLEQGQLEAAAQQLESSRRTFEILDQPFPENDTLYGLYLYLGDVEKAYDVLFHSSGYADLSDADWCMKASRLAEKVLVETSKVGSPDPEETANAEFIQAILSEILSRDRELSLIPYPSTLDSVLGEATAQLLLNEGYFDAFYRIEKWSSDQQEWWYVVSWEGENFHFAAFRDAIQRGFPHHERVIIDMFAPLDDFPGDSRYQAFVGRVVYEGKGLQDSSFIPIGTPSSYSADLSPSRWAFYLEEFGWNPVLFHWNCVVQGGGGANEGDALAFHINYLREAFQNEGAFNLMQLAEERGLVYLKEDESNCFDSQSINCWGINDVWLQALPPDLIAIWVEKFEMRKRIMEPSTQWEAKEIVLSRGLEAFVVE